MPFRLDRVADALYLGLHRQINETVAEPAAGRGQIQRLASAAPTTYVDVRRRDALDPDQEHTRNTRTPGHQGNRSVVAVRGDG